MRRCTLLWCGRKAFYHSPLAGTRAKILLKQKTARSIIPRNFPPNSLSLSLSLLFERNFPAEEEEETRGRRRKNFFSFSPPSKIDASVFSGGPPPSLSPPLLPTPRSIVRSKAAAAAATTEFER